jgi:hypothetical protein
MGAKPGLSHKVWLYSKYGAEGDIGTERRMEKIA